METLNEAKRYVAGNIIKGCDCPCCGQTAKLYKLKLVRPMVEGLVLLYRVTKTKPFPSDYIHTPSEFLKHNMSATERNLAPLRHWGLIESAAPGMWRLTKKGIQFAEGQIILPYAVYLFNRKAYGFDKSKRLSIGDVMGAGFDINAE